MVGTLSNTRSQYSRSVRPFVRQSAIAELPVTGHRPPAHFVFRNNGILGKRAGKFLVGEPR